MKTLILGTTHENTSTAYLNLNLPASELVTSSTQEFTTGHTAPANFATEIELEKFMASCNRVFWAFPEHTEFDSIETLYHYLNWLKEYQYKYKNIVNFGDIEFDPYNWRESVPVLQNNDAVFVGCSFTEGVGLVDPDNESYTALVAKSLGLNCVNLGKGGSSNYRIFDVLNQLNFCKNQTVVVQLTIPERVRYVDDNLKTHEYVTSQLPKHHAIISSHYDSIRHTNRMLNQFLKFAREKKLKFVFLLIDYKGSAYTLNDQLYYYNLPEFVPPTLIENYIVDVATDKIHPGVESQKLIADAIIKHYRRTYEC